MELTRLIGHVCRLALPERVRVCGVRGVRGVHGVCGVSMGVRLHQAAGVAGHRLRLVLKRERERDTQGIADLVRLREHLKGKKNHTVKLHSLLQCRYYVITWYNFEIEY